MAEKKLAGNLMATDKHSCPIKEGVEAWRIIVAFHDSGKLVRDYFVWVTGEFLEDRAKLNADLPSAEKFAVDYTAERYKKSGNVIPKEGGVSCSVKEGIKVIDDAKNFIHPIEAKETEFS